MGFNSSGTQRSDRQLLVWHQRIDIPDVSQIPPRGETEIRVTHGNTRIFLLGDNGRVPVENPVGSHECLELQEDLKLSMP